MAKLTGIMKVFKLAEADMHDESLQNGKAVTGMVPVSFAILET